ncbi:MAG: rhodanese-like domain-containing protein [Campylobacterota bacterium]|nr:rhodanese-like domain-containing protein [Campylobacterota bacterium]
MSLDVFPDKNMLENSEMIIVDIRTKPEWRQTGIVKDSECITFFDARGHYDIRDFFKQIDALGGKNIKIGLICRTGSRTSQVAQLMYEQGYNVKNLAGGVMKLLSDGYELSSYKSS